MLHVIVCVCANIPKKQFHVPSSATKTETLTVPSVRLLFSHITCNLHLVLHHLCVLILQKLHSRIHPILSAAHTEALTHSWIILMPPTPA